MVIGVTLQILPERRTPQVSVALFCGLLGLDGLLRAIWGFSGVSSLSIPSGT